jgi:UDP-N-acetylglucosamine acyltransferase
VPTGENAAQVHPTAIIHPGAQLGSGTKVGPYAVIADDTVVGDGTVIGPHVLIERYTRIGRHCIIFFGAALGSQPQDRKFSGERSYLRIGDRNLIREYVTVHRATGEEQTTVIGDDCMVMNYCHFGHNCQVGDRVSVANGVNVGGHCVIEHDVNVGGMSGIHQYVRIGRLAMVGGMSKITQDVPPFCIVEGSPALPRGLNSVGLRRAGVSAESRAALKQAFRLLYRSRLNTTDALDRILREVPQTDEVRYLVAFVQAIRLGSAGRQLAGHGGAAASDAGDSADAEEDV